MPAGSGRDDPQSSGADRSIDQLSFEPLSEERPVVEIEQPVRYMDAEIRVDPDKLASKAAWWIFDSGNPFVTMVAPTAHRHP